MNDEYKVLIVDDEEDYSDALSMILQHEGYLIVQCNKPREAVGLLRREKFDLVLSDLKMPEMDGITLLKEMKKINPNLIFIIMTAYGTIDNAVTAMKEGAYTYVIKGSDPEELLKEIHQAKKLSKLSHGEPATTNLQANDFVMETKNQRFREILATAEKAAKSDVNILILGESGVGKEVLARYIHEESRRGQHQFIATNCCTFTESLLESELFGHEKGAFTGALNTRIGRFEAANGGTLFLDEIGDIPLPTQSKLLRVIETKTINRIGRNEDIRVDFRLITATNKILEQEIKAGRFREDLYYRLGTIIIEVPPLRQRKEDIPSLIKYFMNKVQNSLNIDTIEINEDVMKLLLAYHYPGNIRELKNIVERMAVLSDHGEVNLANVINYFAKVDVAQAESDANPSILEGEHSLREVRRDVESKHIANTLKKNKYNIAKTAQELEISTRQLFNKITDYNLKQNEK